MVEERESPGQLQSGEDTDGVAADDGGVILQLLKFTRGVLIPMQGEQGQTANVGRVEGPHVITRRTKFIRLGDAQFF